MKKIITFLIVFLFFFLTARAESSVVINELSWMGNAISSNDEWIELRNFSESEIDITGWTLKAEDGSPEIKLEGKIQAAGFFYWKERMMSRLLV
jgi:hypothetical protein